MTAKATIDVIFETIRNVWEQASTIWLQGGWAMIPIAVIALVMFAMGMHVHLRLRDKRFGSVPEKTWRGWIDNPTERKGTIGELLDRVTDGRTLEEAGALFRHLRETETQPMERDLRVMRICVSAAPLVGLLGTVTGMLATFQALATGSGGEKTMALVAEGISEALITTETGLVIALPGLFMQYQLARKHEAYKAFLAHLESVCTQSLYRRLRRKPGESTARAKRAVAAAAATAR